MAATPPALPTAFPCWARAKYSFSGESKSDVGFVEGSWLLIANAGDSNWLVGSNLRDPRKIGHIPRNFIEFVAEGPRKRSVTPLPETPSPKTAPAKSRTFRKPFEAYVKAPHYTTAKQPETFREPPKPVVKETPKPVVKEAPKPQPSNPFSRSVHDNIGRVPSPPQNHNGYGSRAPSPAPPTNRSQNHDYISRSPSPAPPMHRHQSHMHASRSPSPAPHAHRQHDHGYGSRSPSPAPPTHRQHDHEYGSRAPSPAPHAHRQQDYGYGSRAPSPAPSMNHGRNYDYASRDPSPAPLMRRAPSHRGSFDRAGSSPPPAPPPHRHVSRDEPDHSYHDMTRHASNASYHPYREGRHPSNASYAPNDDAHYSPSRTYDRPDDISRHPSYASYQQKQEDNMPSGYYTPRVPSPRPSSHDELHMTPSPLREAMDGVMEQLDQLGVREASPEPPLDPWAPESFGMVSGPSQRRRDRARPKTSLGIAPSDEGYETWSGESSQDASDHHGNHSKSQELPQLDTYVERMEKQFRNMHQHSASMPAVDLGDHPPPPPPKGQPYNRPKSSAGEPETTSTRVRTRKSAYEVGRGIGRSYTTKTNTTNVSTGNQSHTSSSTQSSGRTLWSGVSAGGFSSTSAGSLARTGEGRTGVRAQSALGHREAEMERPETPFTGVTYHSSHASNAGQSIRQPVRTEFHDDASAGLGGLVHPKAPKRNIFKKIFESAKTGVASNRGSLAVGTISGMDSGTSSPFSRSVVASSPMRSTMTGISSPLSTMGHNGGVDWVQVRRDVNRSNTLSKIECGERRDRCAIQEYPTLNPVDELYESIEGDEGLNGQPVSNPLNYEAINLSQVDKNSRFVSEPPPMTTAISLATTYICRPYRSDVQRLRAIFTWVSEKISWEEDFEGQIDTRRVIQTKRGCAEEYAVLVMEMCDAAGLQCEIVRGYLKSPGDVPDLNLVPRSNHWWNAVVVDNEWRIMDCCLASPSHPKRELYSSVSGSTAEAWWFLTRPTEACWTHVPEHHDQQHIVPPVAHEILLNLPCTCPAFFRNGIEMVDYNTSVSRIQDLEMVHINFNVPADIEVAAEVESRAYSRDADGDYFESGDVVKKRALAQAEWYNGVKRYTIKALLPGDEGQGTLKIYAGKRGLMHSIKDIPHPLVFALPVIHTGENPPYEFVTRHPTPHAQRHDIYVVQPQCQRLALNNTFVFAIRQHPSSLINGPQSVLTPSSNPGGMSPIPFARPGSAMSINASSVSGSNPSSASGTIAGKKPAKLAIQTPGGKILRLMRKEDRRGISVGSKGLTADEDISDGATWETIIKCSEKGIWRGLVLADRTARWCVFAEWVCIG